MRRVALNLLFLSCLLISNVLSAIQWKAPNKPICMPGTGNLNYTMFGYSLAISNGEADDTFLVVGRPWDGSVYIYRSETPQRTDPYLYAGLNGESFDYVPENYNLPNWSLFQTLRDTNNGTFSASLYSLFGYSVDITPNAEMIVASSPGKNRTRSNIKWATDGVIRLFKKYENSTRFSVTGGVFPNLSGSVSAPVRGTDLSFLAAKTATVTSFTYNVTLSNGTVIEMERNHTTIGNDTVEAINVTSVTISGHCSEVNPIVSFAYVTSRYVNVTCSATIFLNASSNVSFIPGLTKVATAYSFISVSSTPATIRFQNLTISGGSIVAVTVKHYGYELILSNYSNCVVSNGFREDMCYFNYTQLHEKFGSKVMFSKDANATYLFVVANQGWEGMNSTHAQTTTWSADRLYSDTFLERQGVAVFQRVGSSYDYARLQFLNASSPHPLGTLGLDIATAGKEQSRMTLYVRDYYPNNFETLPGGQVVVYTLQNSSSGLVWQNTSVLVNAQYSTSHWSHEDWFGRGLSAYESPELDYTVIAAGAPRHGKSMYLFYANSSEYFGVNSTFSGSRNVAPNGIRTNYAAPNESMSGFDYAQIIPNPNFQIRNTFFGGTSAFSNNGEFLFIADASNNKWNGRVYMYRRYNSSEATFNISAVQSNPAIYGTGNFSYYLVAELEKVQTANYTTGNNADWFGNAIATNWWTIVASAAVDSCVHSYPMPQNYLIPSTFYVVQADNSTVIESNTTLSTNETSPGYCSGTLFQFTNATSGLNSSLCCYNGESVYLNNGNYVCLNSSQANSGTSASSQSSAQGSSNSADNTKFAIIGAVVALVVVIPAAWFLAVHFHKQAVIKRLEKELADALEVSPPSQGQTICDSEYLSKNLMQTMFLDSEKAAEP